MKQLNSQQQMYLISCKIIVLKFKIQRAVMNHLTNVMPTLFSEINFDYGVVWSGMINILLLENNFGIATLEWMVRDVWFGETCNGTGEIIPERELSLRHKNVFWIINNCMGLFKNDKSTH